jgi:uncharacterized membrane protein
MSSHLVLILVRLVHIVTATLWVGGAILLAGFVAPAIRATGAAGAAVMRQLTRVQRLPVLLLTIGLLALLSGGVLIRLVSGGSLAAWLQSGPGETYSIGAVAALLAAIIGVAVNMPTANRLGALATPQESFAGVSAPQPDVVLGLARRLAMGTRAAAVLLLVSASAMAVARYVY